MEDGLLPDRPSFDPAALDRRWRSLPLFFNCHTFRRSGYFPEAVQSPQASPLMARSFSFLGGSGKMEPGLRTEPQNEVPSRAT